MLNPSRLNAALSPFLMAPCYDTEETIKLSVSRAVRIICLLRVIMNSELFRGENGGVAGTNMLTAVVWSCRSQQDEAKIKQ